MEMFSVLDTFSLNIRSELSHERGTTQTSNSALSITATPNSVGTTTITYFHASSFPSSSNTTTLVQVFHLISWHKWNLPHSGLLPPTFLTFFSKISVKKFQFKAHSFLTIDNTDFFYCESQIHFRLKLKNNH